MSWIKQHKIAFVLIGLILLTIITYSLVQWFTPAPDFVSDEAEAAISIHNLLQNYQQLEENDYTIDSTEDDGTMTWGRSIYTDDSWVRSHITFKANDSEKADTDFDISQYSNEQYDHADQRPVYFNYVVIESPDVRIYLSETAFIENSPAISQEILYIMDAVS